MEAAASHDYSLHTSLSHGKKKSMRSRDKDLVIAGEARVVLSRFSIAASVSPLQSETRVGTETHCVGMKRENKLEQNHSPYKLRSVCGWVGRWGGGFVRNSSYLSKLKIR